MMNYKTNSVIISIFMIILIGCKNEFDPLVHDTYEDFNAFCVLDSRVHEQYVYLQRPYQDPAAKDLLTGYDVYLEEDNGNTLKMRDTIIAGIDFQLYYLPGYNLKRNITYRLKIVKDNAIKQWAIVFIHSKPLKSGSIKMSAQFGDGIGNISFSDEFINSGNDCYFDYQTFVEYELNVDGNIVSKTREMPPGISMDSRALGMQLWEIPEEYFLPVGSVGFTKTKISGRSYNDKSIYYTFRFMRGGYPANCVTIKRAYSVVKCIDAFYYDNYLNNKWDEITSFRFDTPYAPSNMYKSTGKGMGVLGSITCDTLVFPVDSVVIDYYAYRDGQKK